MADLTSPIRHVRTKGDLRIALGAQLIRPDGSPVDLTGLNLEFKMVDNLDGSVKVAQSSTGVTVVTALTGKVSKTFIAADVDTADVFSAFFVITDDGGDTFPADGRKYLVEIVEPTDV